VVPARVLHLWERVRSSYWFIPAIMTVGSIGLAAGTLELDRRVGAAWLEEARWLYQGGPDGARAVLSTIAGSMITVAGVVFSITIVVLSLAASQFGPRLLQNFLRDTGNEVVLGTFIATFLYCLLVLRAVRGSDEGGEFVPHLSLTVGVGTAVLSLGVLIYFIHHVAALIQANNVVASASRDIARTVADLFPGGIGREGARSVEAERAAEALVARPGAWIEARAPEAGYIESLDGAGLVEDATRHDLLVVLTRRPGDFVWPGMAVARVRPAVALDEAAAQRLAGRVVDRFFFGQVRTPLHDVEAAVHRLVEVGVRALSPAFNDPFTALAVVDHLGASLAAVARQDAPSRYRYDADGTLRLVAEPIGFAEIAHAAFGKIRRYGRGDVDVLLRLLGAIAEVARGSAHPEVRAALRDQADAVLRESEQADHSPDERRRVERRYEEALAAMEMR